MKTEEAYKLFRRMELGYKFCERLQDLTPFQEKFVDSMLELSRKTESSHESVVGEIDELLKDKVRERNL